MDQQRLDIRKTKIVCTLGPACDDEAILRELILGGMDVARLNFSHGSHREHSERMARLRKVSKELDIPVAILLDTKGPEIRTGKFNPPEVIFEQGSEVVIRHEDIVGNEHEFSISYKSLHDDLVRGDLVLIDDGLVSLEVIKIVDQDVYCVVQNTGPVSGHKSINLPDVTTHLPALTDQDLLDLEFAAENDVDFIAASFIRQASDIVDIKRILENHNAEHIEVIAKIENREGVQNFNEILQASDGIMVARGDLGVEIPVQEVPSTQKMLIQETYKAGKPCITATQMLDSMIRNPRPTRAEVSDVANAIMDGTSAIMLSGETAAGKYPLQSLRMMASIAIYTENNIDYWDNFVKERHESQPSVSRAISHACCTTAMDLNARAILTVTCSGRTARSISSFRPECPIIASTVTERVRRNLKLAWGVTTFLTDFSDNTDELFDKSITMSESAGLLSQGDVVVITGGTPLGLSGTTNTIKVTNVGKLLCQGIGVGTEVVTGETLVVKSTDNLAKLDMMPGTILVASSLNEDALPLIRKASAIVVEDHHENNYALTASRILNVPLIYACENCSKVLKTGSIVTVNPEKGYVS
ncbi:MAG: pyruvate kinase [Eubacteriales bacterium]|nr:pyruvate kinase [Eubacteriales bacterium]